MLKSVLDFTIPGSTCNLFYKLKTGEILNKTYFKLNTINPSFYINGDTYKDKNGKYINNIFKKIKNSQFIDNLNYCHVPVEIKILMKCYTNKIKCKSTTSLIKDLNKKLE